VAAIGGLAEVYIDARGGAFGDAMAGVLREVGSGALRGAFGDEMAGVHREVGSSALRGAFRDEMAGVLGDEFGSADREVVGDRLVDSVVSALRVLFLRVDLYFDIVLESMFEGMLGCPSEVDPVCALASLGVMK